MNQDIYHIPALLGQTIEALDLRPDGFYVDVTFGGGGHSRAILDHIGPEGHLFSFDQDSDAVAGAFSDPRFTIIHANFRNLSNFLDYYGVEGKISGLLGDLGVSFHHFDTPERGFSFRFSDGPLDMRMNSESPLTAADILNTYDEAQLSTIFRLYGELKQAPRLAEAIVKARREKPFLTIADFASVAEPMLNKARTRKEMAPLFQALRIEVNHEMEALTELLQQTTSAVRPGGRLAIITYHSLEDRLVKNFMKTGNILGQENTDFYGRRLSPWRMLGSKPIVPDNEEIERNPRSRSAKLRVAERTDIDL